MSGESDSPEMSSDAPGVWGVNGELECLPGVMGEYPSGEGGPYPGDGVG